MASNFPTTLWAAFNVTREGFKILLGSIITFDYYRDWSYYKELPSWR